MHGKDLAAEDLAPSSKSLPIPRQKYLVCSFDAARLEFRALLKFVDNSFSIALECLLCPTIQRRERWL